ncbi:MAG: hypothetical protein LJE67_09065 [Salaquimonas sp.]|nr:hypothetical protein [Salaquimonas sp.]
MQSKSIWIGRQKIILLVTITLTGGFVGLAYVGLVYPSGPKKEGTIWLGLVIGLLVAFSIVTFELYFVAHPCSAIRRSSFVPAFLVRVGAQFVLIFVIIAVCRIVNDRLFGTHIFDLSPEGFVGHLQDISFSLVVSYAGGML